MSVEEAVRGGYAMRHMNLKSTRYSHAVDNGNRVMYLCMCGRAAFLSKHVSPLGKGANTYKKFASGYRYK